MMAVDVEATPAADLTAISARWSDPLELAAIIVAATAESATPRGTLDEFLRSTVAAWQDDPRLSRAPASVVRAIATRLFHQMDAPAAASVSSTRLLASGAGATGMAGEALSKPALLSPRDLVILESPQSGVDPPAAGSVDLPSRSEPAVLLRMLSDAQELLLSVQCKLAYHAQMGLDDIESLVPPAFVATAVLGTVLFNTEACSRIDGSNSPLVVYHRFILKSFANGALDHLMDDPSQLAHHVQFLLDASDKLPTAEYLRVCVDLGEYYFYSDDFEACYNVISTATNHSSWNDLSGVDATRVYAILDASEEILFHRGILKASEDQKPSLSRRIEQARRTGDFDTELIREIVLGQTWDLMHPMFWADLARDAFTVGKPEIGLQLEFAAALRAKTKDGPLQCLSQQSLLYLNECPGKQDLFYQLYEMAAHIFPKDDTTGFQRGLEFVTDLACRGLATREWAAVQHLITGEEHSELVPVNILLPPPIDSMRIELVHPNKELEMKRRFITGITLNELPALSAALAQNPSIVEVFAAAVMPRALGFCKEFDFGRAHKLLSLLAPYLSGLSLLLRPQGEILNYVAFELQRAGEDSGQVADQKTSNGTALIATKPIDFLQQVVSLHSNLTLAPAEILHLNVYLTAVALKKLNSDGSSLQFVESVYQMAFNLAAVAVAASNDILNFAKCSRCVFQVVDAFLGLTPRENESDAAWLDALSPASEDVISRIFLFSFDLGDLIAGSIQVRESLFSMLKCSGRRNAILHVGAVLAGLLSTVQTERNKVVLENFGPFTIMTAGPSSSWFSAGSANLSRLSAIVKTLPARSTQLVQSAGGELAEFLVRLYDFVLTLEPKCDRCYKTLLCLGDLKFAIGKYEEAAKHYCGAIGQLSEFGTFPQRLNSMWQLKPVFYRIVDCFRLLQENLDVAFITLLNQPVKLQDYNSLFPLIQSVLPPVGETSPEILELLLCFRDLTVLEFLVGLFKRRGDKTAMDRVIEQLRKPEMGVYAEDSVKSRFIRMGQTMFLRRLLLKWEARD